MVCRKHLAQRVQDEFPFATEEKVKEIVPLKGSCTCMKLVLHSGDFVNVYASDGIPMLIETPERLVPTVCALWKVPDLVPMLTIHPPVLAKVTVCKPIACIRFSQLTPIPKFSVFFEFSTVYLDHLISC